MVGVCSGGHDKLDDDVLAFEGVVVVIHSAIGGMGRLELEVVVASSMLFFKEGWCGAHVCGTKTLKTLHFKSFLVDRLRVVSRYF